jgi:hypothetical protein
MGVSTEAFDGTDECSKGYQEMWWKYGDFIKGNLTKGALNVNSGLAKNTRGPFLYGTGLSQPQLGAQNQLDKCLEGRNKKPPVEYEWIPHEYPSYFGDY